MQQSHRRSQLGSLVLFTTLIAIIPIYTPSVGATVMLHTADTVLIGERPHIRVEGLPPRSEVTVESFRTEPVSFGGYGNVKTEHPVFHAQGTYWADDRGELDLDKTPPVAGTYTGVDPRGLLWSGAVVGRAPEPAATADTPDLSSLAERKVMLRVRVGNKIVASRDLELVRWTDTVHFTTVDTARLVGVFAAPTNARHAPTVILLHGSEGGDFAAAKADAGLWASHGYAAFALIYFSWPSAKVPNAPPAFAHLPAERIAYARDWLARRSEADTGRLGIAGGSKGGEYGLLAASLYPWVRAVVACVPSSVVWGGFGEPSGAHPESFTFGGKAVPYLAYGDYGPVMRGEISSAQRHQRDRAGATAAVIANATIAVERSRARLLLISGGRDAVWPSDAMSSEIVDRMRRFGQGNRVEWLSDPDAGHFQCGTGDRPIRWNDNDEGARGGGLVAADGRAPGRAWERTLAFMHSSLAARRW